MKTSIIDKLRLQHVDRFHMVNTSRTQTVADHSWAVGIIAMEILTEAGCPELGTQAAQWALYHDLDEVYTGDIPTPAKAVMDIKMRDDWVAEKWETEQRTPDRVRAAVKMADFIEAENFLRYHGIGLHAAKVEKGIRKAMQDYGILLSDTNRTSIANAAEKVRSELIDNPTVKELWDL